MALTTRRTLLAGLGAILAAPAIVRVSAIMPVRAWPATMAPPLDVGADRLHRRFRFRASPP